MTVRVVDSFPHAVREIENLWIPMPDGARLAARVWLPASAWPEGGGDAVPVPAIFEYIPYRKRDFTRGRDEPMHGWFAGHGYAALRVDLRGAGDSDGILRDEYTQQELDDAVAAIAWIARQPWCTGKVGMMGISWGGFNALQVAAMQPPELGAIVTLCSTDDRYADDAHYMGGCLLNENLIWGSVLGTFNAYPPDPEIVGEQWHDMWRERLESAVLFPEQWLRHQLRDDYWRHGSVCEDYARITCPVYAIGGWVDGYSNAVPRLLASLQVPRKGLVGPWAHVFPHNGVPGPRIGFLQEVKRWWDQWLCGADTGILDEPAYRVWMQDSVAPQPFYDERPGRWVAETAWPSPRIEPLLLHVRPGLLNHEPGWEQALTSQSPQITGLGGGDWCAFGVDGDLPGDQRADDGRSLTFDSAPLAEPLEILGAPRVTLELAVDRPLAFVAVRLCDVAPDGTSARVSYGLLNLTHRHGHDHVAQVVPGERYRVHLQLNDTAWSFPKDHALRLAVSTCYWPIAWPSPEPVTLTLYTLGSTLELPVRPPRSQDAALRPFAPPEQGPLLAHTTLLQARSKRTIERDLQNDAVVYTVFTDGGDFEGAALARVEPIDLDVGSMMLRRFRIAERDPLSAEGEIVQRTLFRRGAWSVRVHSRVVQTATADEFVLRATLEAFEGERRTFSREWDVRVPRQGV